MRDHFPAVVYGYLCISYRHFSVEETKEAIWSYEDNKSTGSGDLNFNFFKSFWDIIQHEVCEFVDEFYNNVASPRVVTSSFLMRKVVDSGNFNGFYVGKDINFPIL